MDENALAMAEGFEAERRHTKEALLIGQLFQQKYYNKKHINFEFEKGDMVVLNRENLGLLSAEKGRGNKFL
ncbi:hypothetical protein M413DRAFT_34566, partial [Hebeloma cylindrosporum]